jgi:hypothetical protein
VAEGAEDSIAAAKLFAKACPKLPTIVMYGVSMGGNTSGLAVASHATRANGRPLFDYWFDIEGATDLIEEYLAIRAVAQTGNQGAITTQQEIEAENGGKLEDKPDVYRERTVVARAEDIKASGIKGVVMVHDVDDGLVTYSQSQEMFARLGQVGIPTDMFTVATRGASSEPGTTLDSLVTSHIPGFQSPFAGHGSEASDTHIVGRTGFDRLAALFNRRETPPCFRQFLVDGTLGTTVPDPASTRTPSCSGDEPGQRPHNRVERRKHRRAR